MNNIQNESTIQEWDSFSDEGFDSKRIRIEMLIIQGVLIFLNILVLGGIGYLSGINGLERSTEGLQELAEYWIFPGFFALHLLIALVVGGIGLSLSVFICRASLKIIYILSYFSLVIFFQLGNHTHQLLPLSIEPLMLLIMFMGAFLGLLDIFKELFLALGIMLMIVGNVRLFLLHFKLKSLTWD